MNSAYVMINEFVLKAERTLFTDHGSWLLASYILLIAYMYVQILKDACTYMHLVDDIHVIL